MHCLKGTSTVEEDVCLPGVSRVFFIHLLELHIVEDVPAATPILTPIGSAAGSVVALLHGAVVTAHSIQAILLYSGEDGVSLNKRQQTKVEGSLANVGQDYDVDSEHFYTHRHSMFNDTSACV